MEDITLNNEQIEFHKARVFDKHPEVKLIEPCKIGDGIVHFLLVQRENLIQKFANSEVSSTFFIPASGSGSRMFQFLYNFLDQPNEDNRGQVEKFLNNMEEFAFFQKLPMEIKKKLKSHNVNLDEFVAFLLNSDGMAYGELPKGLIPFHKNGPFVLNPFQEQILQGIKVNEEHGKFHYTVNPTHQETISHNIKSTEELSGRKYDVSFSIQNKDTDAIAFDREQNVKLLEDGSMLTRPAGHGALLENLNEINTDVIFIKNIDNIQHYQKSKEATETWKYLGGVALWFREEQLRILKNPNLEEVLELNRTFQFLSNQEIGNIKTNDDIISILNRPIRVCGMVRNEGQPGGGPFWIENQGKISKQIVEKSQISMSGDQYRLMVQSVYFNPVMIACINKDMNDQPFDLMKYRDESKFFVVNKKHKGQDILFSELPGLWNGSMAHWNSIFVEVKSDTFSPVKTILDLLESAHLEG